MNCWVPDQCEFLAFPASKDSVSIVIAAALFSLFSFSAARSSYFLMRPFDLYFLFLVWPAGGVRS